MADVNNTNSSLNSQCMDFCQALARQGLEFKFSVTIGSAFTFSLDARAKEGRDAPPVTTVKKRNSPSTRRRNARRREEYLKRKFPSEVAKADSPKSNKKQQGNGFHCDLCDSTFRSENGMKIHRGKTHKEHPSPEKVREPPPQPPLGVSPPRSQERVGACKTVAWTCLRHTSAKKTMSVMTVIVKKDPVMKNRSENLLLCRPMQWLE